MPVEQIDDPSVNIKPTRKLTEFIKKKVNGQNIPENIKLLKKSKNVDLLKLKDIKWLNNYLIEYRKNSDTKIYLHELLQNIELNLPSPKITPRSPELEARIQKLTAEQNTREYRAMTKEIDPGRKRFPEDTIAYQMKEINKQLIAVAQFIFSVIAAFAFGFIGIELIVGNLDFGFRLLLGIICGLIVALAEIYFLAKKLSEGYDEVTPPRPPLSSKLHQE
ncbi:transmembrane protein 199 [Chelonus insularis]|uniref:transmembrane protein 199 n=1 Tax=Chelonus insularis TaxID=460826 RepID=UPI0015891DD3|nr:transmembrane protein 199 [Chelonus insularis]